MSQHSYILYGAGELGKNTVQKFLQKNLQVLALIDQKHSGTICGIKVDCLENISSLFSAEKENLTVVICLNAGTQHKSVAEKLFQFGFQKIVFLPIGYPLDYNTKTQLTNLYNKALNAVDIADEIACYCLYRNYAWKQSAKIKEFDRNYICWIGEEILFSENHKNWMGNLNNVNIVNGMRDINLNSFYQMHNLFLYLDGKVDSCEPYLTFYKYTFHSDECRNLLMDRNSLYLQLNENLLHGVDLFVASAPPVIWNDHGYFNIIGGNHRTIFLQHQGWRFYPVRMSFDAYEYWLNKDILKDIVTFITTHNIVKTYVPIPHPCFFDFPCVQDKHGITALSSILSFLGPIWLEGKKILDISQYEGCFARTACRLRAEKVVYYNKSNTILELSRKLAHLLHISAIEFTSCENNVCDRIDDFNIIFAMNNIDLLLSYESFQNFNGLLFVEFNPEDKLFVHSILAKSKLISYKKLYQKIVSGYPVEIGVFQG